MVAAAGKLCRPRSVGRRRHRARKRCVRYAQHSGGIRQNGIHARPLQRKDARRPRGDEFGRAGPRSQTSFAPDGPGARGHGQNDGRSQMDFSPASAQSIRQGTGTRDRHESQICRREHGARAIAGDRVGHPGRPFCRAIQPRRCRAGVRDHHRRGDCFDGGWRRPLRHQTFQRCWRHPPG